MRRCAVAEREAATAQRWYAAGRLIRIPPPARYHGSTLRPDERSFCTSSIPGSAKRYVTTAAHCSYSPRRQRQDGRDRAQDRHSSTTAVLRPNALPRSLSPTRPLPGNARTCAACSANARRRPGSRPSTPSACASCGRSMARSAIAAASASSTPVTVPDSSPTSCAATPVRAKSQSAPFSRPFQPGNTPW